MAAASPLNGALLAVDALGAVLALSLDDAHAAAATATAASTATNRSIRFQIIVSSHFLKRTPVARK
jgi:hypothetical protein